MPAISIPAREMAPSSTVENPPDLQDVVLSKCVTPLRAAMAREAVASQAGECWREGDMPCATMNPAVHSGKKIMIDQRSAILKVTCMSCRRMISCRDIG